jgi:hypothetical protein
LDYGPAFPFSRKARKKRKDRQEHQLCNLCVSLLCFARNFKKGSVAYLTVFKISLIPLTYYQDYMPMAFFNYRKSRSDVILVTLQTPAGSQIPLGMKLLTTRLHFHFHASQERRAKIAKNVNFVTFALIFPALRETLTNGLLHA